MASLEATIRATEAMAREGAKIMRNPMRLFSLARLGRGSTRALSKLLLRPPDPKTAFRGKLGTEKRVAWSVPIPLTDVRATGCLVDGTVNDVMLAAITGGLRRYLQSCGEQVDGLCIRTGLSVNLRSAEEEIGLGNHAGAFLVSLPIGVDHPLDRLSEVKRAMDALKNSPEGTMVYGLLNALGKAPPEIQEELVASYCTRETAMTANVAGPAERLNLAGAPLDMLMFWVPAFGGVGLNLNIVSYAGKIRLGVASDRGLVPYPERIIDEFLVELNALQALADEPEAESVDGAVSEDSFEALSAMLDDAARTLDEILEDT
jgi:WS/DGAT/MGAT family acyltransferase